MVDDNYLGRRGSCRRAFRTRSLVHRRNLNASRERTASSTCGTSAGMGLFVEGLRRTDTPVDGAFPWSVPTLASLQGLRFTSPVTFLMGENGSGKSTFIEALAIAVSAVTVGAQDVAEDVTLAGARRLAAAFAISQRGRPQVRMFFRAEDAFGFTQRVERDMRSLDSEVNVILADERATLEARRRAAGHIRGQRAALVARYGEDPHALSHGETFLGILRQRLAPRGLYLLDEPETPLSPTRVLALLTLVHDAVREGSQFIIATHSPILAALPGAEILLFEGGAIRATAYEDLEHVRVTRDFLNAPERYMRHLLKGDDP
jgi:predicted ATPase